MARAATSSALALWSLLRCTAGQDCQFNNLNFGPLNTPAGTTVPIGPNGIWGQISINPCEPLTCPGVGGNALCCLTNADNPPSVFSCGSIGQFTTELDAPGLVVGIEQTQGNQEACGRVQTSIAFRCSPDTPDPGILEWVPRDPGVSGCVYNVTWDTQHACGRPPVNPPPEEEDEGGAFALITLLVVFLGGGLYFIGGTLVNSRLPNASANFYNNIPQRDFWFDLPSLVQDGVAFSVSLGQHKGKKQFIDGYEDVDEEQEALTIKDTPRGGGDELNPASGSGGGIIGAMANSSTTKAKDKKKKKSKSKPKPKPAADNDEPKE